ncbi:MAG: HEAT repeat domain-containing protein [Enhygromyxa sp.]
MAKRDRTQAALDRLAAAVEDPHTPTARAAITKALRDRSNLVVAAALALVYEHELTGFEDAMRAAWEHAMIEPQRHDVGCRIKTGVVKALDLLCEPADELFLAGIRYVQPEPVWGGSQDTAVALRGMCAIALVNRRHADAMIELARLLADPEREARRAAADALAASGDAQTGVPLLILRVRANEPEPEVLGACFSGLLSLDAEQTFDFVVEHLRARDPLVVEAAALALGQARPTGALEVLRELAERSFAEQRKVALLSISMLRSDDAWGYLLGLVVEAAPPLARDAIEALAVYRELPSLTERVREAASRRAQGRELVEEAVAELFGDPHADD